jgi:hypothetical protein
MIAVNKLHILTVLSATLLITGCANRPESIAASYTSHERYMGLDCAQLSSTMANTRAKLAEFSDKQDSAANLDAGGVFLVLIPPSAFAGDSEADVAEWKGKVEAVETAQIKSNCTVLGDN